MLSKVGSPDVGRLCSCKVYRHCIECQCQKEKATHFFHRRYCRRRILTAGRADSLQPDRTGHEVENDAGFGDGGGETQEAKVGQEGWLAPGAVPVNSASLL